MDKVRAHEDSVIVEVEKAQRYVDTAPSLVCHDLGFSVKVKSTASPLPCARSEKVILEGVDLAFTPGSFTAVIGASGAGKTTLLNALAGRAVGTVSGDVRCRNGAFATFIVQDDIMLQTLTPRENIAYAAELYLHPSVMNAEQRKARVEELIDIFHLRKCANTVVGVPGEKRGISGGERKRVSIAMSLTNDPSLIFVDEPTSGLDSSEALNVVRILRKIADGGRTVISTIHQPDQKIFHCFTDLCLMAQGRVAFYGPLSQIGPYFASIGFPQPMHVNTANFLIDLVDTHQELLSDCGDSVPATPALTPAPAPSTETELRLRSTKEGNIPPSHSQELVQWLIERYAQTDMAAATKSLAATTENLTPVAKVKRPYARNIAAQFGILCRRSALGLWRDKGYVVTRLIQTIVIAALMSVLFANLKNNQAGIRNRMGLMFFSGMNQLLFAMLSVLFMVPKDLAVLLREHLNGAYAVGPYMASKIFVDTPVQIVIPIIFGCIMYWSVDLNGQWDRVLIFMAMLALLANVGSSIGFLVTTVTMSLSGSLQIAPLIFIPNVIFSGFVLNLSTITVVLRWMQYVAILKYAFAVVVTNEFKGKTFYCEATEAPNGMCPLTTGDAILKYYDLADVPVLNYFLILLGFMVALRIASIASMARQTRKYKAH